MLNGQDGKCPVCEKTFTEADDSVVCPQCGVPHHRSCYEQRGVCFYADRHGTGEDRRTVSDEPAPKGNRVACPVCGFNNDSTTFFCKRCGESLIGREKPFRERSGAGFPMPGDGMHLSSLLDPYAGMDPDERIGAHSVEELAAFIGPNSFYYLPRFRELEEEGRNVFNYAGAFLNLFWLFFRGINIPGLCIFVMLVLGNYLNAYLAEIFSETNNPYGSMLLGVILVVLLGGVLFVCGFLANRFYKTHCDRQIRRIKNTSPPDLLESLKTEGGIYTRNVYTAIAIFVVVNFIGTLLIGLL